MENIKLFLMTWSVSKGIGGYSLAVIIIVNNIQSSCFVKDKRQPKTIAALMCPETPNLCTRSFDTGDSRIIFEIKIII